MHAPYVLSIRTVSNSNGLCRTYGLLTLLTVRNSAAVLDMTAWKESFPNVTFLKQNLAQSNNRVANFATLAVQVTKERRGKKSASNTRQCNIISIFSWKLCMQVYLLNALKCVIQNG